jgi:hypothetical protein
VPVRRENNREGGELNQEVTGEEFEFAMQPALEQNSADAQLEDGMCDPKRVIKKSNFVAHAAEKLSGSRTDFPHWQPPLISA